MDTQATLVTKQFEKWISLNYNDLSNLFVLYCDNIQGYLNIDNTNIGSKQLFYDFCKFLYSNTSNNLKKYSQENIQNYGT